MPPIRKSTLPDGAAWTPKPVPKRISVPACPNFLRVGPEDKPDYRSVGGFDPVGFDCPPELRDGFTEETNGSELPELRQGVGRVVGLGLLPTHEGLPPSLSTRLGTEETQPAVQLPDQRAR